MTGIHLNNGLEIITQVNGINYLSPKGLALPPSLNKNIRIFSIDKCFDSYKFNDIERKRILENLHNILGEDFSKYKIILGFEKEESETTKERIQFFKNIFEGAEILTLTINIEEKIPNQVIFLNNPTWILADIDTPHFFHFWKYLKRKDLGTIKKKFMFLNNHYSEIRFDILKFLYKNGYDKFGNISFNEILFNAKHISLDEKKFLEEVNEYGIEYPKYYDAYPTTTHVNEDHLNRNKLLGINHVTTLSDFNYRIFLESYFEIITETAPHLIMSGVHISEKIHKPLRTALPFVYYGNPKLKTILEGIGLTFNSPIYYFGLDREELLNHLDSIITKDYNWYHEIQLKYLEEYLNNMEKWNTFIIENNRQILKFIFV